MVISDLRRHIAQLLNSGGVPDAEFDADELICFSLRLSRTKLAFSFDRAVTDNELRELNSLADRRIRGEPLQYIVGEWEFYGLPFYVGEGVLIPRADTEALVDCALDFLKNRQSAKIIDLCSGSGCIAIAIKKNAPSADVTAVELYDSAFSYLEKNAKRNSADINAVRFDVLNEPDDFGVFDLIVTNPPYIEKGIIPTLSKEVKSEPLTALDGGDDGLNYYRAIAKNWLRLIKDDGCVMAEIGEEQAEKVTRIFSEYGFKCTTQKDMNHLDRVIIGTREKV